mmetsp:Transcript_44737/g.88369  ORF Transcript_44737/g.88369 Transcript_44737/m.88369 type:complete len:91 (+) Transcript_44737:97-369(+)
MHGHMGSASASKCPSLCENRYSNNVGGQCVTVSLFVRSTSSLLNSIRSVKALLVPFLPAVTMMSFVRPRVQKEERMREGGKALLFKHLNN